MCLESSHLVFMYIDRNVEYAMIVDVIRENDYDSSGNSSGKSQEARVESFIDY